MSTNIRTWWEALRSTFWVVPTLMTLVAVGMSFALIAIEEAMRDKGIRNLG